MTWLQGDMMVAVESCQELPKLPNVGNSCPGLLKVAKYCHKLPKKYQKLQKNQIICQRLPKVDKSCRKKTCHGLPKVDMDGQMLPKIDKRMLKISISCQRLPKVSKVANNCKKKSRTAKKCQGLTKVAKD